MDKFRKAALEAGAPRYFSGVPCLHGHLAERRTINMSCIECNRVNSSIRRKKNPEKSAAHTKAWREANPEKHKAIKNAWNKANPEGQKLRARKWYEANKDKSFAAHKKWADANPEMLAAAASRRRARVLKCTPPWVDHQRILTVYQEARERSLADQAEYHVDHIVPLQSDRVCGLHVDYNLQILPGLDNRSKGNRFWPNMH